MAMTSMNISLTEDLKAFIDAQVAEGAYATSSEYVRALVRRERDVARVRALIDEGLSSPPGPPVDEAYWERQRERIRQQSAKRSA
jgi:antitoxin ParD1/3/4